MSETGKPIRPKERKTVVQALRAGVVPRVGLHHIQVGRSEELSQMNDDIDLIADGGATIRLIIGDYGAGKTFFLNLVRLIAMEKGLIVVGADLAPDRRLHASAGQARSLFSELVRNMSTRTKIDGGALSSVVERFVFQTTKEADAEGGKVQRLISERLAPLEDLVSGHDFTKAVTEYFRGATAGNDDRKSAALKWLGAGYSAKTDARKDIGVRNIIDDANIYDYLKLYSQFARTAGYGGLLVVLDEMVNLYKLNSARARNSNYEQILRIFNDVLQGSAGHIGFIMGGTPEFLMDTRRGLYSYEALQSRLAENRFADGESRDLSGPVIRLANLAPEELYVLLRNIRHVFAGGDQNKYLLPDEALSAFMNHCAGRIGSSYFQTPRTSVKAFVDLLSILEQHPRKDWRDLIDAMQVEKDADPADGATERKDEDDLSEFTL
ncbi:MAG: ATP-binding protein [Pirellulales bacterium]|nr:ATP-binding protein [Alphaproteobacteria bacterium]MDA7988044.1 ATP-binding protein [Alphaproteobacteria bacterium]MDA8008708.1 ATP-binding protein [Alphaproteobacteria bacterium]MDA8041438.1 ATP-binding protein [Pirellulales bacterium]